MEIKRYQYREEYDEICRFYKGCSFPCFSVKKFKKMFSSISGGYRIIGMLTENSRGEKAILRDGEYIYYEPVKCRRFRDVIIGYVDLGNHEFLAITADKTMIHVLSTLLTAVLLVGLIMMVINRDIGPIIDSGVQPYSPKTGMLEKTDSNNISLPGY